MPRICTLDGVREHCEGHAVELWSNPDSGRILLVAINEGGFNSTAIDFSDLRKRLESTSYGTMVMPDQQQSPLLFILREIELAGKAGLFYSAICIALTLPDICSALEEDREDQKPWRSVEVRYKAWCDKYVRDKLVFLTPDDLWALRGGVIHQGKTFGHPKSRFERVIFVAPSPIKIQVGRSDQGGDKPVSIISIDSFCTALMEGAFAWIRDTAENAVVQANVSGLVRPRPNGYQNHIVGVPIIA